LINFGEGGKHLSPKDVALENYTTLQISRQGKKHQVGEVYKESKRGPGVRAEKWIGKSAQRDENG